MVLILSLSKDEDHARRLSIGLSLEHVWLTLRHPF